MRVASRTQDFSDLFCSPLSSLLSHKFALISIVDALRPLDSTLTVNLVPAAVTTKVQGLPVNIRSIAHDRYLSSGKPEGGVSHQKDAKGFEIFILLHLGNGLVSFRSTLHGRYLSAPDPASKPPSQLLKTKRFLRELEMFTLEHIMDERYALRTYHGKYVAITMPEGFSERVVLANREVAGEWEHFDIEIYKELDKKGPVGEAGSQADVL